MSRTASDVTADALPTAQLDGVAWTQQVVGNTVYVGGSFANARPAGAAAGTSQSPRANLMAYTLSTGVMTAWAPSANAQILASAVSPNGQRLYVAGEFTTINGVTAPRIAAFDTSTGALITSFAARTDATVKAIAATDTTVYVGGAFSTANGVARARLAAFSASNGALLPWNPGANVTVYSLTTTPDTSLVIVGGAFDQIASHAATGLAALDATTGAWVNWAATATISAWGQGNNGPGTGAAIYSLTHDDTNVYGTGYNFYGNGNLEGAFSAEANSGTVKWVEDCHGDTYSVFPGATSVYTVSHDHYCGNIGGFPQSDPWSTNMRHALAFTKQVTGTINHDPLGYYDWFGTPAPSMVNWFPDFKTGTYTGQTQAAWSVTGNSQYVVAGGEFPTVNNVGQQGLVRFAVPAAAPNKQGPRQGVSTWSPSIRAFSNTSARVAIQTNWDRDDQNLTYSFYRDGKVVYTTPATSQFWNRPTIMFVDDGLTAGASYSYFVRASDANNNVQTSATVSVTMPTNLVLSQYAKDVYTDGAANYWRLDEKSGTAVTDWAGTDDMVLSGGYTQGVTGAIIGDNNTADTFGGSNGLAATQTARPGPDLFSEETWFKTKTTKGGKILGFGNRKTGTSTNYDRHVYMNPNGTVSFGVYNNGSYTITTPKAYNDNLWHQVVGTLSSSGMALYVDGKRIGTNGGTTVGQSYSGYWRIGGDSSWSGNAYFSGSIDEVAIYPSALTLSQVAKHYTDSGRTVAGTPVPSDAYGKAVYASEPDFYYRLDEASGPTGVDASGNGNNGVYSGGETFGVASPVAGTGGKAVTFNGVDGVLASAGPIAAPSVYSEEAWFKTTTTSGGKIIGFGSRQTGSSDHYDRHVYMENSGRLTFGTYTGVMNTTTTQSAYNDGNWHYVVATQGPSGMKLFVDGQLTGSNPETGAEPYSGYWRVGGDSTWAANPYFAGTIDEAAFYSTELTPAQVTAHYNAASAVNHTPVAAFDVSQTNLTVNVDGSASTDSDGTISSYAWNFGDGATATGATQSHVYDAGGTYTIKLTVTDNGGASSSTTKTVTVAPAPPNQPPTAAFEYAVDHLSVAFDASTSADTDGTVTGYSWDFGDGQSGTGSSPTHAYAAAGTYGVTLTVTDDDGATATVTRSVTTSAANQAPIAAFTSSVTGLTATFDSSGSGDPDGTIAGYAWAFGDGTTSTSANPSHTYPAGGTYTVSLTVTDDEGASATATRDVTVTAPVNTVVAADDFERTVSSGWGSANVGGAWTRVGGVASDEAVNGHEGTMTMTALGKTTAMYLNSVSQRDVSGSVDVSFAADPTGGGVYSYVALRRTAAGEYRLRTRLQPTATTLQVTKVVSGTESVVATQTIAGLVYKAGDVLRIKFDINGSGTTTITGKVWKLSGSEPAAWQLTATDSTAGLQTAGAIGILAYLSATTGTTAPATMSVNDLTVTAN